MPRRNGNKSFNKRRNRGAHQRRRTTRGHRFQSKLKLYRAYAPVGRKEES
jgi:hypothetical protein